MMEPWICLVFQCSDQWVLQRLGWWNVSCIRLYWN